MPDEFQYDVFLSHNKADKPRVRQLAERLRAAGLRVWFDEWVIQPGDDIYLAIERGLEASRTLVLCLSPAALGSGWVMLERSTVLFRDPSNAGRRFIPLLLADCKLPDTLRRYKNVDYSKETDHAYWSLLRACGGLTRSDFEARPLPGGLPVRLQEHADVRGIRLTAFGSSIQEIDQVFEYELRLVAVNRGFGTLGWSGLSVSIPTINTKELFALTVVKAHGNGYKEPSVYAPGDPIWRLEDDRHIERICASNILIELVVNLWEPARSIDLRAVLTTSSPKLEVGLRAWGHCGFRDWTSSANRDPLWNSPERRDQQGIPAYWHTISLRNRTD